MIEPRLVVLLILIVGLAVTGSVWINYWQSDYARALGESRTANRMTTASRTSRSGRVAVCGTMEAPSCWDSEV